MFKMLLKAIFKNFDLFFASLQQEKIVMCIGLQREGFLENMDLTTDEKTTERVEREAGTFLE